ncbi:hypothetical protein MMC11_002998 [Xylographa trunciseda]|nr:hypothetical protein [Xylographa trunciseda]
MVNLTPAEALEWLTSNKVIAKPKDLNMFDGRRHIFQAKYDPNVSNFPIEYQEALKNHPEIEALHEEVIVGKGRVVGKGEVIPKSEGVGNGEVLENQRIFTGWTWQIIEGDKKTRIFKSELDKMPTKTEIRYIGLTSKSFDEITAIGSSFAERILALMLTTLFSKRTRGERGTKNSL